jgi:PIN domain nuclease of toxin-antitoxin system
MKFLLDTHTLLWFINGDSQISADARRIIEDTKNEIAVSVASLFEISIKLKIGKLSLRKSLLEFIEDVDKAWIQVTPIANAHLAAYQNIPDIPGHRDPFDRLIIATAISEDAIVISADPQFRSYRDQLTVIW